MEAVWAGGAHRQARWTAVVWVAAGAAASVAAIAIWAETASAAETFQEVRDGAWAPLAVAADLGEAALPGPVVHEARPAWAAVALVVVGAECGAAACAAAGGDGNGGDAWLQVRSLQICQY